MVSKQYLDERNILLEESCRLRSQIKFGDLEYCEFVSPTEIRCDGYFTKDQLQLMIESFENLEQEFGENK